MNYSGNFLAVLDACVLYPNLIRDLLLSCAEAALYTPKWSADILDELERNLMMKVEQSKVTRLLQHMDRAFPDAKIDNYMSLINSFTDTHIDPKDYHVVAAAVRINTDIIVTDNLNDFPKTIWINMTSKFYPLMIFYLLYLISTLRG